MVSNYVIGRSRETQRLVFLRRTKRAVIGGRFRGSKISKGWLNSLGFNPKLDLWWIDQDHITHLEQVKTASNGYKARISKSETHAVQEFANRFRNSSHIWVGIVLKNYHQPYYEVRLN